MTHLRRPQAKVDDTWVPQYGKASDRAVRGKQGAACAPVVRLVDERHRSYSTRMQCGGRLTHCLGLSCWQNRPRTS